MPLPLLPRAVALAGALPLLALAATDSGQILNEQQRSAPPLQRRADPPVLRDTDAPPAPAATNGLRMQLKAVRFTGATTLATDDELQAQVASAIGRTLGHAELQALADGVTRWLRGRGFLLARAWLPRQDVTAGTLEIALIDGRLQPGPGRVGIEGTTRIDAQRLRAIAQAALPEDRALHNDDLERALLLLNDLPGLSARGALVRGDAPGTSRLVIEAREDRAFAGSAQLDNFGGRSTGVARVGGRFDAFGPLALGDALGLVASASEGTKALGASYGLPLSASGWRLLADASALRYEIGGELAPLELKGDATTFTLGVSYPLLRTRAANLTLQAAAEHKRLTDDGLGASLRDRQLFGVTLSLSGQRSDDLGGGGFSEFGIALSGGHADLSRNEADRIADAASARTHGHFDKLSLRASRVQAIGQGSAAWSLFASLNGQLSARNLDSSEKFILGGPNGVRAYPVGEAPGDAGAIATVELRRELAFGTALRGQAFAFADAGTIQLHAQPWPGSIATATGRNRYSLSGAGIGLNLTHGAWSARGGIAHALGDNPGRTVDGKDADGRASRTRAWVQAGRSF